MNIKKTYGIESLRKKFGPLTMAMILTAWRESEEISQSDFAKKLKITRANLCDYEKQRKFVGPERAVKFAKILGLPEEFLLQISLQDTLRAFKLNYVIELKKVS